METTRLDRPEWATDETPFVPQSVDNGRPYFEVEAWSRERVEPIELELKIGGRAVPLAGAAQWRARRRWWWPFGDPGWITVYFYQEPEV